MPRTTAAIILGVIGGLFGFATAIGGFVLSKLNELLPGLIPEEFAIFVVPKHIAFPLIGVLFATLGIIGASMAGSEPKLAGLWMILSAVGGAASVLVLYVPPYLLLWAAAYFAFTPDGLAKVKPTSIWYLFPIFLGIVGGCLGYNGVKTVDKVMAKRILILGIVLTVAAALVGTYWYFYGLPF